MEHWYKRSSFYFFVIQNTTYEYILKSTVFEKTYIQKYLFKSVWKHSLLKRLMDPFWIFNQKLYTR